MSVEKGPDFLCTKEMTDAQLEEARKKIKEINKQNTNSFRQELKANKISFIKVLGKYDEFSKYDNKRIPVEEQSTIIISPDFWKAYRLAKHWAIKTKQDSILIASDGEAVYEYTSNNKDEGLSIGDIEYVGNMVINHHNFDYSILRRRKNQHFAFVNGSDLSKQLKTYFNE